jgi:hypothetical protein
MHGRRYCAADACVSKDGRAALGSRRRKLSGDEVRKNSRREASTQKPVTQRCGRVLNETIHLDKNTMPDRTGQLAFELLFHST